MAKKPKTWSVDRIQHPKYPGYTVRIGEHAPGGTLQVFRWVNGRQIQRSLKNKKTRAALVADLLARGLKATPDAIFEIELALAPAPTPFGLLNIVPVPATPQESVNKANEAIRKYRNSGLISDFIPFMQALLAKENKPDPNDSG